MAFFHNGRMPNPAKTAQTSHVSSGKAANAFEDTLSRKFPG
jgi:hypothetical protein